MPTRYDWDALASELFDYLADKPDGLDLHEIRKALDLPRAKHVHKVVRRLREVCGEGDVINVSLRREGNRAVYFLAGTVEDVMPWTRCRMKEQVSKLQTQVAVWRSIATGTDGRTVEGKVARHVLTYLLRILEDIRIEMDEGDGTAA